MVSGSSGLPALINLNDLHSFDERSAYLHELEYVMELYKFLLDLVQLSMHTAAEEFVILRPEWEEKIFGDFPPNSIVTGRNSFIVIL
jgi:hypothetical protein